MSGFALPDGRLGGLCSDGKPRCVRGHRLHLGDAIIGETIGTCIHRASRAAPICGAHVYVAQLTVGGSAAVRGTGERVWLVVEVTRDQVEAMKRRPMLMLERMVLLGTALAGVEGDVLTLAAEKTA